MPFVDPLAGQCGGDELHGLSNDPVENVIALGGCYCYINESANEVRTLVGRGVIRECQYGRGFWVFSDNSELRNGEKLAKYLTKHGLGSIITTPYRKNHNTGAKIKIWVYHPNIPELKRHMKALYKSSDNNKRMVERYVEFDSQDRWW